MTKWESVTVPLIVHATKQILDQWGEDGYELVQVVPGPDNNGLVAYLKRPKPWRLITPSAEIASPRTSPPTLRP